MMASKVESNANADFEEDKNSLTLNGTFEQILAPTMTLTLGYTFARQSGFLANAYRRVLFGPLPFAERHPERRYRHAGFAKLGLFVPATNTAIHTPKRSRNT